MLRRNKNSSIETVDTSNLSDQIKFRLNKIMKFRKEKMSEKLSKYIAAFDDFDKALIAFNCFNLPQVEEYLLFFGKCYWSSCRNSKGKFYSLFSLATGIIKKELEITRNKKEKR